MGQLRGLQFRIFTPNGIMRIDSSALRSLSVIPPLPGSSSGSAGVYARSDRARSASSLVQMLDVCCTPAGSRLLREWLVQPSTDVNVIEWRLDCVEGLLREPTALAFIRSRDCLRGVVDFSRIRAGMHCQSCSLPDLIELY